MVGQFTLKASKDIRPAGRHATVRGRCGGNCIFALIAMLAVAAGCSDLPGAGHDPGAVAKENAVMVPAERFDDELSAYVGQTVTLEGLLVWGNFSLAVCPPEVKVRGCKGVAIHADGGNKQGHDAIMSFWKLARLTRVQVTGELHVFDGAKADKSRSEMDVWPFLLPTGDKVFWIEVVRGRAI